MIMVTIKFEFCRFCKAQDILPVAIMEKHDRKYRIAFHCPVCGEMIAITWVRRKKGDDSYLPRN